MLNKLIIPVFAIILVGSLLVTPLIPLLDKELGKTIMLTSGEEEESSSMEEMMKKFDETTFYIKYFSELRHELVKQNQLITYSGYLFPTSDHTLEILDPPPRQLM
ncbi:hypothetical protein [Flagellimonas zhangzhouensis]|uniref:Uncharacterized protein n=1 Tax=Flagellimonas zhangzhouensis TaxID=1073328 RepID=A0A1H2V2X2_9FLAO|nr:hypothetical protein [Allomuricauda zhangzhouensis]SDQ11356.1 hypothetical protein SAMN05216294_0404 [Allomuricauda zhangzhouensis]SDW62667.1 hypothetical protein SAMN04487892_1887 [Allomuricauda zhangzhouensis]